MHQIKERFGASDISSPYVLVVIDCQPGFAAAQVDWLQKAVCNQIERAARDNAFVVVLEMSPGANLPTVPSVTEALQRSGVAGCMATKYRADGSAAVLEACRLYGIEARRFRVCGVDTDACVYFTVRGLLQQCPAAIIEVPTGACNCYWDENPWEWFRSAIGRTCDLRSRLILEEEESPKNSCFRRRDK